MRYHADERRRFWGDIFDTTHGDVNLVRLNPGVTIAWHRHQLQDDKIWPISGDLLIQAIDLNDVRHQWRWDETVSPYVLIPRGWWHGYGTETGATLLQFNGPSKWDGSDEQRMSLREMPWIAPTR